MAVGDDSGQGRGVSLLGDVWIEAGERYRVARRKPLKGWAQGVVVVLFAAAVLGMAWITQYAMIKASQRPRASSAPVPK